MTHTSPGRLDSDRLARRREHLMTEIAELAAAPQHAPPSERRPARSAARWLAAAAAVVALAIGIGVVTSSTGGPTGHGPAAFAIEPLPAGGVSIRVVNTKVSAQDMTAQLHEAGLSISIDTTPSSPQLVGRWLILNSSEGVTTKVNDDVADQTLGSTSTLEIHKRFSGELTLTVGRAPEPGEAVTVSGTPNALAPGGLLHCTRLAGASPDVAETALTAAGYTVVWAAGGARRPLVAPPAGSRVVQAYLYDVPAIARSQGIKADGKTVQVIVMDPADPLYAQILWTGWPRSQVRSGERDYSSCPSS